MSAGLIVDWKTLSSASAVNDCPFLTVKITRTDEYSLLLRFSDMSAT
jgi:hypothetical protein